MSENQGGLYDDYDQMNDRYKEGEQRAQTMGRNSTVTLLKPLPGQMRLWKPKGSKEGVKHYIEIIPFRGGQHMPKPGLNYYTVPYACHYDVGPQKLTYLCLASWKQMAGHPPGRCPICEERMANRDRNRGNKEDTTWKKLMPKDRNLYNILCLDSDEEISHGVQVWNPSYYDSEEHLLKAMKDPRDNTIIPFAHPSKEKGRTVYFMTILKQPPGFDQPFPTTDDLRLLERKEGISQEELAQAIALDELIIVPTYDEVYAVFHGDKAGGGNAAPGPASTRRAAMSTSATADPQSAAIGEAPLAGSLAGGDVPDSYVCPDPNGTYGVTAAKLPACQDCKIFESCLAATKVTESTTGTTSGAAAPAQGAAASSGRAPMAGGGASAAGPVTRRRQG